MEDEEYTIVLAFNHPQLLILHTALEKSWRNWPGGHPMEQMVLEELKNKTFTMIIESQFSDLR